MFNLKDLGNVSELMGQAKELQKQQDLKHQENVELLRRIAGTLEEILAELKTKN